MKSIRSLVAWGALLLIAGGCGGQAAVRETEASAPGSTSGNGSSGEGQASSDSGAASSDGTAPSDATAWDSSGCNYNDPSLRYVAKGSCATIDWGCTVGVAFQNACGCGCTVPDGG